MNSKKDPEQRRAMSERERRRVLEAIARDESAYPRDRIAAVRALQEMTKQAGERRARARAERLGDLDRELDRILE